MGPSGVENGVRSHNAHMVRCVVRVADGHGDRGITTSLPGGQLGPRVCGVGTGVRFDAKERLNIEWKNKKVRQYRFNSFLDIGNPCIAATTRLQRR